MLMKQMKREILNDVLSERPDGLLYHYTTQTGLLGIIGKKQIWATHTQYLNDSREFSHALQVVRDELEAYRSNHQAEVDMENIAIHGTPLPFELGSHHGNVDRILLGMIQGVDTSARCESINVCVASFSENGDSLSQWRAYAQSGGFCIGVRGKRLAELAAPHNFNVVRCLYRHDQQQKLIQALIQEVLEENLNGDGQSEDRVPPGGNLQAYLNRYAPILKHPSFEEEHEWRIVSRPLMCSLPGFRFRLYDHRLRAEIVEDTIGISIVVKQRFCFGVGRCGSHWFSFRILRSRRHLATSCWTAVGGGRLFPS